MIRFLSKNEAIEVMNHYSAMNNDYLFVINYQQNQSIVVPLTELDSSEILYNFLGAGNDETLLPQCNEEVVWQSEPETMASYSIKFNCVQRHLHLGNSFLTNLTCPIPVTTNLSLRDIYLRSQAKYKLWLKNQFVCFSPEIFVRINQGIIASYPMKGTIDATSSNAEKCLMANKKEAAEHATIVDLIRNDLSMVAEDVHVARYRYVDRLQTNKGDILQTSSKIVGKLPSTYKSAIGDILFRLLPAGSITGAPKCKTQAIITEAENYDRNFYTGVMGTYINGQVESAVMIRYIEEQNGKLVFKAGGGITTLSSCEDEYNELKQKVYVPIY